MAPAAPAPPAGKGGRAPGATPTRKQGRPGGRAPKRGGGPGAGTARLAPEAKHCFHPGAKKRGLSEERLELCRGARAVGEFFDLTSDLKK